MALLLRLFSRKNKVVMEKLDHDANQLESAAGNRQETIEDKNQVSDHTACRLGRWYYDQSREDLAGNRVFRSLEEPHQRLHSTAAQAVAAWNSGHKKEAVQLVREVVPLSQVILSILTELQQSISLAANNVQRSE